MGYFDCVKLTSAEWPDHMVEGRDLALLQAMCGGISQWDRDEIVRLLPVLRRPDEEWSDDELQCVDRLIERLGLDEMALFAYGTMIVKRRGYVAGSLSRAKPPEPLAVVLDDGEHRCTVYAMPHPTLGVPEISERGEDGYWTISAGGCAWIKARVSLGEGVRLWNELVNCARYPDAPVLTRGMLE
ncbi:hypothetical protein IU871_004657 [Salmonella enterica subsp. enterica serovar Havana]|uniref:hypothetical protein n=1 Tax=Enterobacterales TaxID=91347 RepID=UPI0012869047|nr:MULTISPECIES: hypothetical protein [Enterobacterales]EAX5218595.1 hypothetical protein [Salmonella enterica]EBY4542113.1 hypothetical protein [Salmonella enterica subsp. enterica serovar Mbandaka]EHA0456335.1 hypothetical protein [Salmonella enterica subsp. enterica serovar Derby]EHE2088283.1 hypothetical protein [Salmonella enterica subsp. enterica serovar Havana]HDC4774320.1 hypothetical protein [Enterobacter cloacae]